MTIDQVTLPDIRVASYRQIGMNPDGIKKAFTVVCEWACRQQLFNGSTLVIGAYWDDPKTTPLDQYRLDACVTLAPDANPTLEPGIVIQTLPGGLCATSLCSIYNYDFCGAWKGVAAELANRNAQIDQRPAYEIYYGPCAETNLIKKWVVDIVFPLKAELGK